MKTIVPLKIVLAACAVALFALCQQPKPVPGVCPAGELSVCNQEVSKRFREMTDDVATRLSAFASEVAADQLFSLRLLAEGNRSAPEVTAKAGQFMSPMGFSVLTILDSASIIISSGDFPASTGNNALQKASLLTPEPKIIADQILGKNVLTLQAKRTIKIVDSIPLYALGGMVVDDAFLARLSPREGVVVLLKQGGAVIGMPDVKTISEVKDNKIVINDKEYGAFQLPLPFVGEGEPPVLIVLQKPSGV